MDIVCQTWSFPLKPERHPQWLIVQIDHADTNHKQYPHLHQYLAALLLQNRLARVVVDEAHIALTHAHFRPVMDTLTWLASLGVNLVVMTATLPPQCEANLMNRFGSPFYKVLRAPSVRANIEYSVVDCPPDPDTRQQTVTRRVCEYYRARQATLAPGEVIIVFCLGKQGCEAFAAQLGIPPFHSECPEEQLADTLQGLRRGKFSGVAATSLLSVGFDLRGVRCVIHAELPRNVLDYEQAVGRAGRDGRLAEAVVFVDQSKRMHSVPRQDTFGVQAIIHMVTDDTTCRRVRPSHVLDGIGYNCPSIPDAKFCDVCSRQRDHPDLAGFSSEYPPDLLQPSRLRTGEFFS